MLQSAVDCTPTLSLSGGSDGEVWGAALYDPPDLRCVYARGKTVLLFMGRDLELVTTLHLLPREGGRQLWKCFFVAAYTDAQGNSPQHV